MEWSSGKLKSKNWEWQDMAKTFGKGVLFGFLIYILSEDGGVSIGLGLLMMYLENKFK